MARVRPDKDGLGWWDNARGVFRGRRLKEQHRDITKMLKKMENEAETPERNRVMDGLRDRLREIEREAKDAMVKE